MYKSDYKKQKEFEYLILNGKKQEVIDYYNNNYYSVNIKKNKFNALYNLAIRGDVDLFKTFMSDKYKKQNYKNINIRKFTSLIIKNKKINLLKEIINNMSDINFYFYLYITYDNREQFNRALYEESLKKECPFEIFEFILINISTPSNYYYITEESYEVKIIKKIIKNSRMALFEKKIIELLKYKSLIEDYFIKFCLDKNKKNYIMKYLEILEDKERIKSLLSKLHTNTELRLIKRFKNIHGIKLNQSEKLEIVFHTKNKNLLKEIIKNNKEKYNVLLNKIGTISEENFNCFLEQDKEEVNEFINNNTNDILNKCFMLSNMPVIRYVLKVTNLKKFDNNLFYSCAFKTEEDFLEVMKDERLHYDTEDFKGLEILIKYDYLKKLDIALKIPRIRKGIKTNILLKLINEKRINTLKVIVNNIKEEELENYENLPEEIKYQFKVKNF